MQELQEYQLFGKQFFTVGNRFKLNPQLSLIITPPPQLGGPQIRSPYKNIGIVSSVWYLFVSSTGGCCVTSRFITVTMPLFPSFNNLQTCLGPHDIYIFYFFTFTDFLSWKTFLNLSSAAGGLFPIDTTGPAVPLVPLLEQSHLIQLFCR